MIAMYSLFIGAVGVLLTFATVLTPDDGWAIVLGATGFVTWGLFAYSGLDIVVVTDATTYTFAEPVVVIFGLLMALIPGYVALTGPADIITSYARVDADDL